MPRTKLPIGLQSFRKLREGRCYYVDKTPYIRQFARRGQALLPFASRGVSARACFSTRARSCSRATKPLFEGLAIHDAWDWSVRRPVLRLSFGRGNFMEPGYLHTNLMAQLDAVGARDRCFLRLRDGAGTVRALAGNAAPYHRPACRRAGGRV